MDFAFKSAKEKLEREHRERKEKAKPKLEQERKAKDAARTQRQAIEASQRVKRIEAMEAMESSQRAKRIEADAAITQRQAIKDSQRAKRIEASEAQMKAKLKRKEVGKSKGGSLTDRMKALHLPDSDEEKEDVESKGKKRCYQESSPWWYLPGMRQEAKADGGSQGLSAVKKSHLPNSDEEEEDVESKGGSLTKRNKMSYLTSPPWWYAPGMRQQAKANGGSQGLSAVKKSPMGNGYDKEFMYLQASYAYTRKHQEVAEKPNQQESAGELTPELQAANTSSDWYEEKDEEEAPVAAHGSCKMWTSMRKQKKKKNEEEEEEDDWV